MDAKTLEALKGSIAKWKAIAEGSGADRAGANCPLCLMFADIECTGCPVRENTGLAGCDDTPFWEFADLAIPDIRYERGKGRFAVSDHAKSIAQKEVEFLESLLPSNTGKQP